MLLRAEVMAPAGASGVIYKALLPVGLTINALVLQVAGVRLSITTLGLQVAGVMLSTAAMVYL